MSRIVHIGGLVLALGYNALIAVALYRWGPDPLIVGLVSGSIVLFFIVREFRGHGPRRWTPRWSGMRRMARRWPPPVAERVQETLRRCEAKAARQRAWLDAAPSDDPVFVERARTIRREMEEMRQQAFALWNLLGVSRSAARDAENIDRIFELADVLDALCRR